MKESQPTEGSQSNTIDNDSHFYYRLAQLSNPPGPKAMYICLCKGITDNQIREAVKKGATRFGQVRQELGFASQCGKCGIHAREVFDQSRERNIGSDQLFYAVG